MVVKQSGKASRRLEREKIRTTALLSSLNGVLDILKEFIRTANSNPIAGMSASMLFTFVLNNLKVITDKQATIILVAIGAVETANVASDILDEMPWNAFKSPVNDAKPSATTVVYADKTNTDEALESARMGVK